MMTGPLSPKTHGYFDYAGAVLLALAPSLFNFSGRPATLSYVLAVALVVISLLTAYPLGVAKVIPFTTHGAIEGVGTVFLIISPWLLGFSHVASARNFFIVAGIGLGILFFLTNYKAAERPHRVPRRAPV